ncbi:carcinoembryonic antigen-related cell adhesion molecule 1 isoform X1 [Salmo trutta]|uniref:carcinoembryonic antigen-related cell adhesion molecule 1 isoform X1 n=2 Tax=Salmo trutta TaxID=8032 RepID=UPI001131EF39|nr:carcinoembryonic antigen-related cell adhesion molecule 1-like isoform X1 [Salmo trutta]
MVASVVVFLTMAILSVYCAGLEVLPPGPVNGTLGGNVFFKTTINPTTLSAIVWTFGDPPVIIVDFLSSEGPVTGEGYVGRISLDNSTGSLELLKLTIADNGEYRVILRESDLMYLSNTSLNVYETVSGASITITPNPPIIEGGSVTLTCDAAGFNITREWMKDGHPVSSGDNIILSEDKRVLSIKKRTDSGEYLCRVSNHVSSENASDTVNVIYGPDGMEIKDPTEIEVGQKFTLTCSADSNPPASYTWMHNETEIPGHSPEFTKEKSEYSDSGEYSCTATNDVTGNKTSVVHKLSVKAEGSLTPDGLSVVVITGIVIIVLLVVEVAVSVAVYFMKKNGSNVEPMHRGGSQQHVYENPSPVYENPSPVYENPSPVYENTSPVYENPSPVRDNTQQNQSPPLPLTDFKSTYDTRIMQ